MNKPMRALSFVCCASASLALAACQRDPSFTLPVPADAGAAVRTFDTTGAAIDLGNSSDDLCVIQSVSGLAVSAVDGGASAGASADAGAAHADGGAISDASSGAPADSGVPVTAGGSVTLYVDDGTGTWHLVSTGAVHATIACASWTALGGARSLTRFDNGGGNTYTFGGYANPSPATSTATGTSDCFLSDLEGDYSGSNGATIDGSALVVTNQAADAIYASAICLGAPPVAFTDVVVNARTGPVDVDVPAASDALCGLAAIEGFGSPLSSIRVADGHALGTYSYSVVRCFLYAAPDAH